MLTHNDVVVYRCYTNDDIDHPETFVFTTNRLGTDAVHPDAFDVRDLTMLRTAHRMRAYPHRAEEMVSEALVEAIEKGVIPFSEEDQA